MSDESLNWLIVGLGNPGPEYEMTRHNAGFMVIDRLAERWGVLVKRTECRSLTGQVSREVLRIELVKPQTFMNLSGEAVRCLLEKESRNIERLIVVVDDLAIPFGNLRIRPRGSDGGHNGLKSLRSCLKTDEYTRLRIGIMPEHPVSNTSKYVLERFSNAVRDELDEVIEKATDAVEYLISEGIDRAMSRFNS